MAMARPRRGRRWAQELQPDGSRSDEKMADDGAGETALGDAQQRTRVAVRLPDHAAHTSKTTEAPGGLQTRVKITRGRQLIARDGHPPAGQVGSSIPAVGRRAGVPFYLLTSPPTLKLPL